MQSGSIGLGAKSSVLKVQEVCAAGRTEACERVKFTEAGSSLRARSCRVSSPSPLCQWPCRGAPPSPHFDEPRRRCDTHATVNESQITLPRAHLLLIEDDAELRTSLAQHLRLCGFAVTAAERGDAGLHLAQQQRFDLVLLDIMLPGMDGLAVLEQLRREQAMPVMLMSALGAEQDRISGFTSGADDYLPKPFSLAELDARLEALLRRVALDRQPMAHALSHGLEDDSTAQDVSYRGRTAGLTGSEFRLLNLLRQHLGEPLSKAFLYQQVLHRPYTRLDRGLDVHVCNLRRKLATLEVPDLHIQAVRNQGYMLVDSDLH